jgi:D-galactarolactone cycloisomerase
MRIAAIETILVQIPYEIGGGPLAIAGHPATALNVLLVRVDTDAGISGWGEAFGHGVAPATKLAIDLLIAPMLIGRDPRDIRALMLEVSQALHLFGRNGPVVYGISGVDIALWDIAGKQAKLPLHQMLGGTKCETVPVYASLLRYGDASALQSNIRRALDQGYCEIKLHEIDPALAYLAREVVGDDIKLMLDTNCPWTVAQSREIGASLRPLNLRWLEEPIWPPENHRGLADLRRDGLTIAAGENAAGLHDFRAMFECGALDVAQPSVTKVGGITEAQKIIALAEAFGVRVVPHCAYFGPGYLASLHLVAALGGQTPLEHLFMNLEASLYGAAAQPLNGRIRVPSGAGLGHDPDPDIVERYRM